MRSHAERGNEVEVGRVSACSPSSPLRRCEFGEHADDKNFDHANRKPPTHNSKLPLPPLSITIDHDVIETQLRNVRFHRSVVKPRHLQRTGSSTATPASSRHAGTCGVLRCARAKPFVAGRGNDGGVAAAVVCCQGESKTCRGHAGDQRLQTTQF